MSRRLSQWAMLLAALSLMVAVIAYNSQRMQSADGPPGGPPGVARPAPESSEPPDKAGPSGDGPDPAGEAQAARPDVAVVRVRTASYRARVTGYGEAKSHHELALAAQVAGRVVDLSKTFETGRRVREGDVLVQLEDSDYRAAVATAEHDLASARLDLLEEERQGVQARAEWAASGLKGEPDSPLVLRAPYLSAAEAAVAQAAAKLDSARVDLERTRIVAPFDALVVERDVAPGSYLQSGAGVATLNSTDRVEIAVPLSARDWRNLPGFDDAERTSWPAKLTSVEDGQSWTGHVLRAEGHRDEETRQRALVVALDRPLEQEPPLLPGTFLMVQVQGLEVDGLWRLPSSALSQRGEVWYLREDDTLASFPAEVLFADADAIFIAPPGDLAAAPQPVLAHPLNGYLQGMSVNPIEEIGEEAVHEPK